MREKVGDGVDGAAGGGHHSHGVRERGLEDAGAGEHGCGDAGCRAVGGARGNREGTAWGDDSLGVEDEVTTDWRNKRGKVDIG